MSSSHLRVLHVVDSLDPRFGGPPAVVLRLAVAQAGLGNEVGIVSCETQESHKRIEMSLRTIPNINSVKRFVLTEAAGWMRSKFGEHFREWIVAQRQHWDFVHIHQVWDPAVIGAARACLQVRLPYSIIPHGSLDPWALNQGLLKKAKKAIAMQLLVRKLLAGCDFIHALNEAERTGINRLKLGSRIEVIPNGVFLEELSHLPDRGQFRATLPVLGDDPFVLFLGRLHFKKGLDYLVEAFKAVRGRNPSVHLVVAGPDDGGLRGLQKDIAKYGLEQHVHVVGPLFGVAKFSALVDATAFCLPSRMEGFSIAVLEALVCRCPVVISEQCNFPEVSEHGAGIVCPLEPLQICDAIESLIRDEKKRALCGDLGFQMVSTRFTWPKIAEKLQGLCLKSRSP